MPKPEGQARLERLVAHYQEQIKRYETMHHIIDQALKAGTPAETLQYLKERDAVFSDIQALNRDMADDKKWWESVKNTDHGVSAEILKTLLAKLQKVMQTIMEKDGLLAGRIRQMVGKE